MPGRHRKSRSNALALRLAGGLITGTALTATVAAAYAGTASGKPVLGQGTANAAVVTPAGAMVNAAAHTPAKITAAGTLQAVPLRAAHARLAARQDARQQAVRQPAVRPQEARAAAPQQEVRKQDPGKQPAGTKQVKAEQVKAEQVKKNAAPVASAQDVINLAKKQVGIEENANGVTKFQQWYMTTPQARMTVRRDGGTISGYGDAAWCDMFVSWVGQQVGVRGMGQDAYTVEHAKWFQKAGRWGTTPKPGAVVFFAWNGGGTDGIEHVGLVVKDNGDGTIETVEGNTNDAVMVRERSTDSVVGYGYPEYAK
ncbi:CHAP domain-containing protein [Actinomadura scrupuli]|uniref:CHAP domain-containing protein n=1 Tax=Actinomadura scrupuli TaxID=559629 RepID=UPI003D95684E